MDKLIGTAMLLALLLLISYFALAHPLYTWDIVPYVAAAMSAQISDPIALHSATYQILQSTLSEAEFTGLISGPYAADLSQNPEHFASQLNMYYVKPLYVAVLQGAALLGANPITAIRGVSLLSGLLVCCLIFHWLKSVTSFKTAAILVILFSLTARLIDLSRVPTPDNFSALIILLGVYLLLVKQWLVPAVIILAASILVRTNNMVFVGLWNRYSQCRDFKDSQFRLAALGLIVSISFYLVTNTLFDYQWWRLFYHTFVESQVNIDAFAISFSFSTYFSVLKAALQQLLAPGAFIASALLAFLLILIITTRKTVVEILARFIKPSMNINLEQVTLLCLPVFFTVLILFPLAASWDRFLTAYYALILIYSVTEWQARPATSAD
jgi:hypothetical protein